MDQFVCVRLVQANGLDLELFQFDYDLTFSIFFMNGDKTIYGRYGTRSSQKGGRKGYLTFWSSLRDGDRFGSSSRLSREPNRFG